MHRMGSKQLLPSLLIGFSTIASSGIAHAELQYFDAATWNMQRSSSQWSDQIQQLTDRGNTVIALQEVGAPPATAILLGQPTGPSPSPSPLTAPQSPTQ